MATANQVPESSMEEILASIRKIISEDEAKLSERGPDDVSAASLPKRPASNVSRLFREEPPAPAPEAAEEGQEAEAGEPPEGRQTVAPAIDWSPSPPRYPEFGEPDEPEAEDRIAPAAAEEEDEPVAPPSSGTLLSPRADAAVASAFNHLASTILSNNTRTIEQMAEEMMRPMLKNWLDENLPPLVERLVREEIERVSRRR